MSEDLSDPIPPDAIAAHDRIAKFYRFRTPYGASFFRSLAEHVGVGPESVVLDLCCGSGPVAVGLAPYCREIDAVDGAPAMIAAAQPHDRVAYHLFDINAPEYSAWARGRQYDLITIGMGSHWLSDSTLAGLQQNLRSGCKIAILATGFSGPRHNPWILEYQKIRAFLSQESSPDWTNVDEQYASLSISQLRVSQSRDWTGETRFPKLGYARVDLLEQFYKAKIGVNDLVNHLLSFSSEAHAVAENYDAVRMFMGKRLDQYLIDGKIDCVWTSSARLFAP